MLKQQQVTLLSVNECEDEGITEIIVQATQVKADEMASSFEAFLEEDEYGGMLSI